MNTGDSLSAEECRSFTKVFIRIRGCRTSRLAQSNARFGESERPMHSSLTGY